MTENIYILHLLYNNMKRLLVLFAFVQIIVLMFSFASAEETSEKPGLWERFINWLKSLFTHHEAVNATNAQTVHTNENVIVYNDTISFYEFKDKKENAFTIDIPNEWNVSSDSGLIRPYIDAGVLLKVTSLKNQGFYYISPYAIYTEPSDILSFAGFTEGTYYDPSGGISTPMLVKSYVDAKEFLNEYVNHLDTETEIIETIDRPDLIKENPGALVTQQSAAEITFMSGTGSEKVRNKIVAYIYEIQMLGIGLWSPTMFGYYSPDVLFNETEYLVLKSEQTFKVDSAWAAKEAQEVNKRLGIISSTQASISETISSTFEYKSKSQDKITNAWSKAILGIEEVYDPDTGDMHVVDSGSKYYWIDNQGTIYGTDIEESPRPLEDLELMSCPECNE